MPAASSIPSPWRGRASVACTVISAVALFVAGLFPTIVAVDFASVGDLVAVVDETNGV